MKDISRKIYLLRILHNYTQAYVAGRLEISPSAYISIEQDATNITVKRLNSILEVYNISFLDFFSFSEDDVMNVLRKGNTNDDTDKIVFKNVTSKVEALNKLLFQLLDLTIDKRLIIKKAQ